MEAFALKINTDPINCAITNMIKPDEAIPANEVKDVNQ
jgi:hypothetical protein